jgi:hypothetical protein
MTAVFGLHSLYARYSLIKSFLPTNLLPTASGRAPHRMAQPIRIRVDVLKGSGLGADMTLAKGVVFVTFDGQDLLILVFDFQATHGFTEVAGAVVGLDLGHSRTP